MADAAASNKKKRTREGEPVSSSSSAPSPAPNSGDAQGKPSSKAERNRKQKLKKRAKKQTAEAKVQRRAERRRQTKTQTQGGEAESGMNDREEMAALLLDGVPIGEQDKPQTNALPPSKKVRDFASDLKLYLDQWQAHQRAVQAQDAQALQYSPWKFNKVLQAWALEHCIEKDRLPLDLFKQLLLYIATVRGGARERLRESMIGVIQSKEELAESDENIAAEVKRAKKVLVTLGKSDDAIAQNQ